MFDFNPQLKFENKRVLLEPLEIKHLEFLVPIALQSPNLLKFSPAKFGTIELLRQNIENNISLRKQKLKYSFAIYDKAQERYAGSTSFLNISNKDQRIEIGSTWIGKEFQQTGLNRNCKLLLMQYVFEVLEFERLELKTDQRNLQSQKAIEAIGGKYEGTLRSHTLMTDGYRRNTVYYSILMEEWESVKEMVFSKLQNN